MWLIHMSINRDIHEAHDKTSAQRETDFQTQDTDEEERTLHLMVPNSHSIPLLLLPQSHFPRLLTGLPVSCFFGVTEWTSS